MSDRSSASTDTRPPAGAAWPPLAGVLVALGHLPLLAVIPADVTIARPIGPDLLVLVVGEGLLVALLALAVLRTRPRGRGLGAFLAATAGFGGVFLTALGSGTDLWLVALVLGSTMAVATYLLHRVELVRLGLVGGDTDT